MSATMLAVAPVMGCLIKPHAGRSDSLVHDSELRRPACSFNLTSVGRILVCLPPCSTSHRLSLLARLTTARLAAELADKSALRTDGVRHKYELFGSLSAEGSVYEAAQYEDEYDDTYDSVATGGGEPNEEAETDRWVEGRLRPLTIRPS